jgi:hypothetical protein
MEGTQFAVGSRARSGVYCHEKAEMTELASKLSLELDEVKRRKGTIMTTTDEFYKSGPGPSSSHTIGPMRITHDFCQPDGGHSFDVSLKDIIYDAVEGDFPYPDTMTCRLMAGDTVLLEQDTTVDAMALTAREMNAKYKETSEGGLAVSLVLC